MTSSSRFRTALAALAAATLALSTGAGVASAQSVESPFEPRPSETSFGGWALCIFLTTATASANPTPMPVDCLTPTLAGSVGSLLDPMDASSMEPTGS